MLDIKGRQSDAKPIRVNREEDEQSAVEDWTVMWWLKNGDEGVPSQLRRVAAHRDHSLQR